MLPTLMKSCFRCGAEFPTCDQGRICPECRSPKAQRPPRKLTFREEQVVELVSQGKTNKEIASRLLLAEGTIKEYLNRIFAKVGVTNRTELAVWAVTQRPAAEQSRYENRADLENQQMVS